MEPGFLRSLILTVFLGFCAACLFWLFRHILERAFYETGEGWKEGLKSSAPGPNPPRR